MTISLQTANVYTDLQGLDAIRRTSDENSPETLRFVAEQFEAIFLQMMLKSAHGEKSEDGLFDNQQTEFYQDWHDKQLSIDLASGKGVGIAEMLIKQLQTRQRASDPSAAPDDMPTRNPAIESFQASSVSASQSAMDLSQQAPVEDEASLDSPQSFVKHLWPLAKDAADKLGVAPEVLLAQAALETGWGKKISRNEQGGSSNNLFNIKADGRWDGARVTVHTLEYRDGVAKREQAHFRAYDSLADSFADYVAFMKQSPRYQTALDVAADSEAFTRELSQAGYATDPNYANKIMRIANGGPLKDALDLIKI